MLTNQYSHQIILRCASKLLDDANLDTSFWPEAIRCAAYYRNRLPSYRSSANFRFFGHWDDRSIFGIGSRVVYIEESVHPNEVNNKLLLTTQINLV